ncbi:MAG: tripartite tricarboxylate transporter substrate binding protein [Actinomycetota bacterium]|nr:tripartite tricarboxylate transporter substrate binding protein [Actinomycetota bacterium]
MVGRTRRHSARSLMVGAALVMVPVVAAACSSSSTGSSGSSGSSGTSSGSSSYPVGSVTLVSPVTAGSNGDLIARELAKEISLPPATVSVVDLSGGAGISGMTHVVQAAPDGSTIGLMPNGVALLQPQLSQLPYGGPSTYTPIAQVTEEFDALTVSADAKWKTFAQFISYAKANPGKVTVEVAPKGSVPNINVHLLEKDAGVSFTLVPGIGAASAVTDLVGGHVDAVVGTINSAQSYIKAGKMAALAVMAPSRLPAYPSVPTMKESGYDVEVAVSNILIGPPHLPASIVSQLASAIHTAVTSSGFQQFATGSGVTVSYVSGAALTTLLSSQYSSLGSYIKQFYSSSGS